ncbi:MAG: ATP-dependent acyl-CoA ligase [Alphaproteobacteria bacterium]|nr:ATP-dependent acyl-CoA ligase [Alphaproteobacteria bacterium]
MSTVLPLAPLEERTVPDLLDRARGFGLERPFFIDMETGDALAYGAFLERVSGTAHALAARFPAGATVATLISNRPEAVILRFALSCAGLCEAAINGAHKGPVLAEMLRASGAAAVVVEDRFRVNLDAAGAPPGAAVIEEAAFVALCGLTRPWAARPDRAPSVSDACRIIYTSGSSGVSKGAELSHGYEVYTGYAYATRMDLVPSDRWFYVTPFFHIDSVLALSATLHAGGAYILGPRFSASRFWSDVMRTEASVILYVGTILAILMKQGDPPKSHKVRVATGVGGTPASRAFFEERHGIPLLEIYGLSECAACALDDIAARRPGSCGRPLAGYEVIVADASGRAQPVGKRGEILIRPREPWALFSGYRGNAAGTIKAFSNLWFHTGDLGSFDEGGHIYFHGRVKDVIRTRDENVSAEELEAIVEAHPQVMMAAAVGVPGELGDEDILLYVRAREGQTIEPAQLCAHLAERCAPFMVPHHVKIVDAFPMTPTEKIAKSQLPRALDAAVWSRPRR